MDRLHYIRNSTTICNKYCRGNDRVFPNSKTEKVSLQNFESKEVYIVFIIGELTLEEFMNEMEKDEHFREVISKSFELSNVLKIIQS